MGIPDWRTAWRSVCDAAVGPSALAMYGHGCIFVGILYSGCLLPGTFKDLPALAAESVTTLPSSGVVTASS